VRCSEGVADALQCRDDPADWTEEAEGCAPPEVAGYPAGTRDDRGCRTGDKDGDEGVYRVHGPESNRLRGKRVPDGG